MFRSSSTRAMLGMRRLPGGQSVKSIRRRGARRKRSYRKLDRKARPIDEKRRDDGRNRPCPDIGGAADPRITRPRRRGRRRRVPAALGPGQRRRVLEEPPLHTDGTPPCARRISTRGHLELRRRRKRARSARRPISESRSTLPPAGGARHTSSSWGGARSGGRFRAAIRSNSQRLLRPAHIDAVGAEVGKSRAARRHRKSAARVVIGVRGAYERHDTSLAQVRILLGPARIFLNLSPFRGVKQCGS